MRQEYGNIIDLDRVKNDYKLNNINERSFVCFDPTFFGTTKNDQRLNLENGEEMKFNKNSNIL